MVERSLSTREVAGSISANVYDVFLTRERFRVRSWVLVYLKVPDLRGDFGILGGINWTIITGPNFSKVDFMLLAEKSW